MAQMMKGAERKRWSKHLKIGGKMTKGTRRASDPMFPPEDGIADPQHVSTRHKLTLA